MSERFSARFPFASWPNLDIPVVAAGVYAIWRKDQLIYCGMSGRGIDAREPSGTKRYGLITRLASHASGRLSGDQFCVYVANRFVLPTLTEGELRSFEDGSSTLDARTRAFIHAHLDYSYALVPSSADAYALERSARSGKVFGQKPYLNPL